MNCKISILIIMLLTGAITFGQRNLETKAMRYYQSGKIDSARILIDSVCVHPETVKSANTWYYKGYIYKDLYNKYERGNKKSLIRLEAVNAFFKQTDLDTIGKLKENVIKNINYLATTIYNDAVSSINPNDYPIAISNFEKYKEIMRKIEPEKNFKDIEIELNTALGSIYMQIYENDRLIKKEFFEKAKNTFLLVIGLDSNNYTSNYNLSILYYNAAVNIIKELDYNLDLITLDLIQEETVVLFKMALPYMVKSMELNPQRKESLVGLAGIYFSLNEMEKSEEIEKKIKLLDSNDQK